MEEGFSVNGTKVASLVGHVYSARFIIAWVSTMRNIPLGTCHSEIRYYRRRFASTLDTPYSNETAIHTRDGDIAHSFVRRVNVGMIGVNVPIPVPFAYHTFGSRKISGFGDLNQHSSDAFRFYTRAKTVTSRWPSGVKEGAEFSIPVME